MEANAGPARRPALGRKKRKAGLLYAAVAAVSVAVLLCSVFVDETHAGISEIIAKGFLWDDIMRTVICALSGGMLALSGSCYQGIFRNPMVSPGILGVLDGTSLGIILYVFCVPAAARSGALSLLFNAVFGFGAFLLVILVTRLLKKTGGGTAMDLMLVGLILSGFFDGLYMTIQNIGMPMTQNGTGNILYMEIMRMQQMHPGYATNGSFAFFVAASLVFCIPLFLMRFSLNLLSFGDSEAGALGLSVRLTKAIVLVCSTALTVLVVNFCGKLGWIGFVAPNVCRAIFGPDYRKLLPASLLVGAVMMNLFADLSIVLVIPMPIVASVIGVTVFLFVLNKTRRGWM